MENSKRKSKSILAKCDSCCHEFKLNSDSFIESEMIAKNEPIIFFGFACPNCNKLYRIAVRSLKSSQLSAEIARLRQMLQVELNLRKAQSYSINYQRDARISALRVKIKNNVSKLRIELNRLKDKFPGDFTMVSPKEKDLDFDIDYRESTDEKKGN